MDKLRVFLDEHVFLQVKDSDSGEFLFGELKRILGDFFVEKIQIMCCDIFSMKTGIKNGAPLFDWIYSEPNLAGLDQSDVRDLLALFQRCSDWGNTDDQPAQLTWEEDHSPANSKACFHAWLEPRESELPGLISVGDDRFSDVATLCDDTARRKKVFILSNSADVVRYYRAALRTTRNHDDVFQSLASSAFPKLIFAKNLFPTKLGVDLNSHMEKIVHHLSFLCDRYSDTGEEVAWDQFHINRAAASLGIDLSDESSNTKGNAHAMRQRKVVLRINDVSREYSCTLHTKLEPTRGRIHFYVERIDESHRIIVGLFEKHLDT